MIHDLTHKTFEQTVKGKEKPCVVNFKSDDCHHCIRLEPEINTLNKEYENFYNFYRIDVDSEPEAQEFLDTFGDGGVPSIFIYRGDGFTEIPWEDDYSYEYLKAYFKKYLENHEIISQD